MTRDTASDAAGTHAARWLIGAATFVLSVLGIAAYVRSVASGGPERGFDWGELGFWDAASAALFAVLWTWIAFSFCVATFGFCRRVFSASRPTWSRDGQPKQPLKTAVLVPVYNESPDDVFARIEAMMRGIARESAHNPGIEFDFFVLSDSTNVDTWLAEEQTWASLRDRLPADVSEVCRVFYRHRNENKGRKAGNIADFCHRWSQPYPFMIVLDADSLMSPSAMFEMTRRMDADPRLGILQVPPAPIGRASLFARLQQFAAQAYGPVFVEGFDAWAGDQGNYWGHNAIIRVEAFCQCCDLPVLPGQAPLGGEILSHDFVEAALMVRRGWKVRLATDLAGSYEECPTTLTDYAQRDQRWCQGNLQHSRLVVSEGFHPVSRLHFASGVMSYVASPLWILFTVTCLAGRALDQPVASADWFDRFGRFALFGVAMVMLLIPKAYGVAEIWLSGRSTQFGGAIRVALSAVLETVMSVLLSPIMAVLHSRFVVSTLRGRKVHWGAQQRDEHGVTLGQAASDFGGMTAIGILATAAVAYAAPPLLPWFVPILAGWLLAIPLAMMLGSRGLGVAMQRLGLLIIPEETDSPRLYDDFKVALDQNVSPKQDTAPERALHRLLRDPAFLLTHQQVVSASESAVTLSDEDRHEVLRHYDIGIDEIPAPLQRRMLCDVGLLRQMHVGSLSRLSA
ncbi:glucans biosynthesis glucosyltransferase MdoH [Crateriforma spongiae]|uniref:glucans biosynthesis glucosyltransferase MdoH n=1 Tax=Crateriforma spongiae TaxID=2724528 RepID=UPI001446115F|nr:glucans biosynthesis glucosyltransferase MdoH [Crateriforma spongiae]